MNLRLLAATPKISETLKSPMSIERHAPPKCTAGRIDACAIVGCDKKYLLELSRSRMTSGPGLMVRAFAEAFAIFMHSHTLLTTNPMMFTIIFTRDPNRTSQETVIKWPSAV